MQKMNDTSTLTVPAKHNPRLQALVDRINADEEVRQWWRCSNVNAVDRLSMSDHGEVHIRIVANAALRLLRLLREAGYVPGVMAQYHLAAEEAEVVVVLAAALHDVGITIHYDNHPDLGLPLAHAKAKELLAGLYPVREQTILIAEALHAIAVHHGEGRCLTLEAGALKLADALDITAGRVRPLTAASNGAVGAATATVVDEVVIKKGVDRPVRVELRMSRAAGLHQLEESLMQKLQQSPLFDLVEIVVRTEQAVTPLYDMITA
jgi:uncharacterized protein